MGGTAAICQVLRGPGVGPWGPRRMGTGETGLVLMSQSPLLGMWPASMSCGQLQYVQLGCP